MKIGLVTAYLAAIVAANLSIAHWGPEAAIYNAFVFIGLDLTCRDRLHDLWRGRLIRNMALLIAAGSGLSYVLGLWLGTGPFVARIALASMIAFGAAATVDAIAYHYLRKRDWYERVNGSNILGAGVDSLVFVALWPFGFQFTYAFTLWVAKVAGGVVWAMLLRRNEWLERNRDLYGARWNLREIELWMAALGFVPQQKKRLLAALRGGDRPATDDEINRSFDAYR